MNVVVLAAPLSRSGAVTQSRTEVVAATIDLEGRSRRVPKPLAAVHAQLQSLG
jgi:hypothetical protein